MTTSNSKSLLMSIVLAALTAGCAVDVGDEEETIDDETSDESGDTGLIIAAGTMEYNVAIEDYRDCVTCGPTVNGYKANGALYGKIWMDKYGDYFIGNDWLSGEGYDLGIHWTDDAAGRQGLCRVRVHWGSCNKNLPEGHRVGYQIGRCKPSTTDCTRWANYGARSGMVYTTNNN
jgi:hypothetical protein